MARSLLCQSMNSAQSLGWVGQRRFDTGLFEEVAIVTDAQGATSTGPGHGHLPVASRLGACVAAKGDAVKWEIVPPRLVLAVGVGRVQYETWNLVEEARVHRRGPRLKNVNVGDITGYGAGPLGFVVVRPRGRDDFF